MSGRVGVEQTPDIGAATVALMAAMGCKVESDSPEGPCCEPPAACHGHGLIWYCTEHDWQEDGNSEGVCGYALMLAQALAPVLAAAVREGRAAELRVVRLVEQDMTESALEAWRSANAREGLADHEALLVHADALSRWSERLRMALEGKDYRADRIAVDAPEGGEGR